MYGSLYNFISICFLISEYPNVFFKLLISCFLVVYIVILVFFMKSDDHLNDEEILSDIEGTVISAVNAVQLLVRFLVLFVLLFFSKFFA